MKSKLAENLPHLTFHNRLRGRACDTPCGHSMWHLIACDLVEWWTIEPFLEAVRTIDADTLLDDLRECPTAPLPLFYRDRIQFVHKVSWEQFNRVFLHRSVVELCEAAGVELFGFHGIDRNTLPPVIRAFNADLRRRGKVRIHQS